jgi:hypothetical protein
MILKDQNPDKEATDAQIQSISADLNDDNFEYREVDQFMDQRRS